MSLAKFISMLSHRALYFARLDTFADQFEGSMPTANTQPEKIPIPTFIPEDPDQIAIYQKITAESGQLIRRLRKFIWASTWHMSEHESAAMWQLYSLAGEAVAIRSTFRKLNAALPENVCIGTVNYVDYATAFIPTENIYWPFIHKRKSFEHEREVRALLLKGHKDKGAPDNYETPTGYWQQVDLKALILKVHVAPISSPWFLDVVKSVVQVYGLSCAVEQSEIDRTPLW